MSAVLNKQYPIVDHAKGMYVYDTDGKCYIDCAAGIAVVNIGHSVPEVIDAIKIQAERVCFTYGGTFTSEPRLRLAEQIIKMAPQGMERVFFCSGGSEAIESLLKIARQYQIERGCPDKYKVITRWQSYHGNTIATLGLGGRPSWRSKYDVYLPKMPHIAQCNCFRCPYGLSYGNCGLPCAYELERIIKYEGPETVSAFLIEPITGTTAAATVPPKEYIQIVRDICDKYDVLFCVDEVITGFGRTGKNFAIDHFDVVPDLIGIAKGLASGYVPLGGVIVNKKVADAFVNGSGALQHSFTFAGNPLACAAASAALSYIEKENLVNRSAKMGKVFLEKLKTLSDLPMVGDVRGIGLMLGIEFVKDKETRKPYPGSAKISSRISKYCFNHGVIVTAGVSGSADGVDGEAMQIAPPFIISEEDMEVVVTTLREGILETYEQLKR
ncbi:MAG: aspartate aminotransferase family protein [Tepidanaerobacteraceae bacterium]